MSIGYADMTIRDFLLYAPGAWVPVYSTANNEAAVYRLGYDDALNADMAMHELAERALFTLTRESGATYDLNDVEPVRWEVARTLPEWPERVLVPGATLLSSQELKFHRMPVGYVTNVMGTNLELLVPEAARRSAVKTLAWQSIGRAEPVLAADIEGREDWPVMSTSRAPARTVASSIAHTMQMGNVPFMATLIERGRATANTRAACQLFLQHSSKRVCVLSFATALVRSATSLRRAYVVHKQRVLGTITWEQGDRHPTTTLDARFTSTPAANSIAAGFAVLCDELFGDERWNSELPKRGNDYDDE